MAVQVAERSAIAGVAVLAILVTVAPDALLGVGVDGQIPPVIHVRLIRSSVLALNIPGRDVVHLLEIGKEELAPRQGRDEEDARKKNDGVLHD
jgi:hypothetical protein